MKMTNEEQTQIRNEYTEEMPRSDQESNLYDSSNAGATFVRRASRLFPDRDEAYSSLNNILNQPSLRRTYRESDLRALCRIAYDYGEERQNALNVLESVYCRALQDPSSALVQHQALLSLLDESRDTSNPLNILRERINKYIERYGELPSVRSLRNIARRALVDYTVRIPKRMYGRFDDHRLSTPQGRNNRTFAQRIKMIEIARQK